MKPEAIFPLTPTQQGMLFHHLHAPSAGYYLEQGVFTIAGAVDLAALQEAWQRVSDRHAVLRTAFSWRQDRPLHVVFERVPIAITEMDWRAEDVDHVERLRALLIADRRRGIDLRRAPLFRLALIRVADDLGYLVWTHLHALLDGWSGEIILRDVLAYYDALRAGRTCNLPAPPAYETYIAWLDRQPPHAAEAYWREALADFERATPLPISAAAAGANASDDDEQGVHFERRAPMMLDALRRRAADSGLTLGSVLLGAWGCLLGLYAGESDVIFGATVAGRPPSLPDVERIVGLFINTLPVRVRIDRDAPITAWLGTLQREWARAQQFGYAALADIQRWSDVPAGASLFDSLVVIDNFAAEAGPARVEGSSSLAIDYTPEEITGPTYKTHYPILLNVPRPVDGSLTLKLTHHRQRVPDAIARDLLHRLGLAVDAFVAGSVHTVGDLMRAMLPELIVAAGAAAAHDAATGDTLIARVERHARQQPDAVALRSGDGSLTYAGLMAAVRRLSARLDTLGVQRQTPVVLVLDRSIEFVVALLAVLHAGAYYVPLDPAEPADRLGDVLEDVNAPVIITRTRFASSLPSTWASVLCLDEESTLDARDAHDAEAGRGVTREVPRSALAYVIYTSGSTGTPKGVGIEHRHVAAYAEGLLARFGTALAARSFAWVSTPAADLGNTAIFASLWSGGCLHTLADDTVREAHAFGTYLGQHQIDCVKITPTHLRGLLDADESSDVIPRICVVLGGEALQASLVTRIRSLRPTCRVWNHYGPTECTVGVIASEVSEPPVDPVPLGVPLPGVQAYVLDDDLRPLPPGAIGMLHLGGASVGRGYQRRPGATAAAFRPDPFSDRPGARLYRTGDRARLTSAGEIVFLGRVDRQVKIRGHRVELGEIEQRVRAVAPVSEAIVLLRGDGAELTSDPKVVAYVVPRANAAVDGAAVRAALRDRLPAAMLPAAVLVLPRLPLTANGKVDTRALLALDLPETREVASPPQTPAEELIANIFGIVLQRDDVGRDDDFFALGGHSLLAMRVLSRLREAFGVELPVHLLFDDPTPARLAPHLLTAAAAASAPVVTPPLGRVDRRGALPLSSAQQRMWFLSRLDPESVAYNSPKAFHMTGTLDARALRDSFTALVARHEALRTGFRADTDGAVQWIADAEPVPLPVIDLSALPASRRQAAARRVAFLDARRPFDLASPPLLRTRLLRLADGERILLLVIHHIVSDGWSAGVLARDLAALYRAHTAGAEAALPRLEIQYGDFAVWQRQVVESGVLEPQLEYWRTQLAGASVLELPTDRPRTVQPSHRGRTLFRTLDAEFTSRIREMARREGVTRFTILLAACYVVLARYTQQRDVAIGSIIANRTRRELEPLIGFFANTLVLRTPVVPTETLGQLLTRVRTTILDGYVAQDMPFDRLVERLQPGRDLTQSPLFRVLINYQAAVDPEPDLPGIRVTRLDYSFAEAKFDLVVDMADGGAATKLALEYATELFDEPTIDRFWTHVEHVLRQIVGGLDRRIEDVALTPVDEWPLMLARGAAVREPQVDAPVHELFARHAAATPDAIAVVDGEHHVSYGALDARAHRVAVRLRQHGVSLESRVGLCCERRCDLVTAIIGVMKAGGAYVPLDPTYPPARLASMLDSAGSAFVLTDRALVSCVPPSATRDTLILEDAVAPPDASVDGAATWLPRVPSEATAYIIFTSGSTGGPKGAVVTHANVARFLTASRQHLPFGADDVWTLFHSYAFDFSVWELWGALAYGGRLVVVPFLVSRTPELFRDLLVRHQVTVLNQTPSAFRQLLEAETTDAPLDLQWLLLAGETLEFSMLRPWIQRHGAMLPRIVNMYGITETSVFNTWRVVDARDVEDEWRNLIGPRLPDVDLYVLDETLAPVPVGVPGELYLGGASVTRGYASRPGLTAERYIPDPFSRTPGARLYRSGDGARWTADGDLEFRGRLDQQVKMRGFRIELGEIRAVLERHEAVQQALVTVRRDDGEPRIVAYVVPKTQASAADDEAAAREQRWQHVFDEAYTSGAAPVDPTFNIAGWTSSYTGLSFGDRVMREWVDTTVARLRELPHQRVLEIGCGTGLLLFQLAAEAAEYHAIDASASAVAYVERHLGVLGAAARHVHVRRAAAHELDGLPDEHFDLVVLNSVVQYFPDVHYLMRVLDLAVRSLRRGGVLFIGDVRNYVLLEALTASVLASRAAGQTWCGDMRRDIQTALRRQEELLLSPAIGGALMQRFPRIARVDAMPRAGVLDSELTRYRYDLVCRLDRAARFEEPVEWKPWVASNASVASVVHALETSRPRAMGFLSVPNRRTWADTALFDRITQAQPSRTLSSLGDDAALDDGGGVDPAELWALADRVDYDVSVSWARADKTGAFDVFLKRRDLSGAPPWPDAPATDATETIERLASPLHLHQRHRWLEREIRERAARDLPEYMVPRAVLVLGALPLTRNGKVDMRALPEPGRESYEATTYVAPRSEVESVMAAVWADVLGLERVGIRDGFFALGGHSILAVHVISRLREALHVDVPVRAIFQYQTIEELAREVEAMPAGERASRRPAVTAVPRRATMPASTAQRRLWYVCQIDPHGTSNMMTIALVARGAFDPARWARAVSTVVARHEVLRTLVRDVDGSGPVQTIAPPAPVAVPLVDVSAVRNPWACAHRIAGLDAARRFDLDEGPLHRWRLVRVSADEHVVYGNIHHLVCDGGSIGVLIRELTSAYAASDRDRARWPALTVQYADYAAWESEWLREGRFDDQLAYWEQQLRDLPAVRVRGDDPPRDTATWDGDTVHAQWSGPWIDDVLRVARDERASIFMLLLATLQILLTRITGADEVPVGTPIANRHSRELEHLAGPFLNTLVLRGQVHPSETFKTWLGRVRETTLQAYAHQDVPFDKLVEHLAPERAVSRTPFFEVVLNGVPKSGALPDGFSRFVFRSAEQLAKDPLSVYFEQTDTGLRLTFEYQTARFSRARVEILARQLEHLLRQAVHEPGRAIGDLSLVLPEHRPLLPDPAAPLDAESYPDVCEQFAAAAAQYADGIAVRRGSAQWSYATLARAANGVAEALVTSGVKSGEIVGIFGSRGFDLCAAMLGTFASGGAILLIDPALTLARQRVMLREAGVRRLLAVEAVPPAALVESLPPGAVTTIAEIVRGERARVDAWSPALPPPGTVATIAEIGRVELARADAPSTPVPLLPSRAADDGAYVFYTSGTTGVPRGILGTHRGLARFLCWQRREFGFEPTDRSAQVTALSFDVVLRDILTPLTSGATLCVPPADLDPTPDELLPWMAAQGITRLHAVPSLAESWVSESEAIGAVPSLRTTFFAGEPLKSALVERWRQRIAPAGEIVNLYGPTEATLANCCYRVRATGPVPGEQPVGWPLPGTQALVMRGPNRLCGVGEPGEVVLRSAFLTKGPINADADEVRRFALNVCATSSTDRVYWTGDRGCYRVDGALQLLGRDDSQVKVRGVRVELGEIEAVLRQMPAVEHVVALVHRAAADPRLVAYVTLRRGQRTSIAEMFAHAASILPEALVPSSIVKLDRMPTTAHGKLDRAALPAPEDAARVAPEAAPRTETEQVVFAVWAQLLGSDRFSIHDNFFQLGGHSLLATQVVSRLRRALRVELPLRALLEEPTVAGVAARIEAMKHALVAGTSPPLVAVPHDAPLPLSPAQARLWFLQQLDPDSVVHHNVLAIRVRGTFEGRAWVRGVRAVIGRHALLRTRFPAADGRPRQVIDLTASAAVPFVDVAATGTDAEREAVAVRVVRSFARRRFDLAAGPLHRWMVVRLAADEHVLVVVVHHMLSDGWSRGILARDLGTAYRAYARHATPDWTPLPVQYADYAVWQHAWLAQIADDQLSAWRKALAELPVVTLPTDVPRPSLASWSCGSFQVSWKGSWIGAAQRLARHEGATLFMALLASLQAVLCRWTGEDEVPVGTPIANRPRPELDALIGCFTNTLVLRGRLRHGESFRAWLAHVRDVTLHAYANQDVPLERVVEAVAPDRDLARTPLFSVMLAVHNLPTQELTLDGASISRFLDVRSAHFELTFHAVPRGPDAIDCIVEYAADLFTRPTIERLVRQWERLLREAARRPDAVLDELSCDTEDEQDCARQWGRGRRTAAARDTASGVAIDTASGAPSDAASVVDLFDAQVTRQADSIAIAQNDEQWSYGCVSARVTQLATHLRARGVGADVRVAIWAERGVDAIAAMLAVMQAGGAYVPLDPDWPVARLALLIADATCTLALAPTDRIETLAPLGVPVLPIDSPPNRRDAGDDVDRAAALATTHAAREVGSPDALAATHAAPGVVSPDSLAYVLFTSGSTGVPKPVAISRGNLLVSTVARFTEYPEAVRGFVLLSPLTFDSSVAGIYWTLCGGGTLVLLPRGHGLDPDEVSIALERHAASHTLALPSVHSALLDVAADRCRSLERVIVAGEACSAAVVDRHFARLPHVSLSNEYGPTEATVWCAVDHLGAHRGRVPIGRPVPNARLYVVDDRGALAAIGAIGELLVGGATVGRGYAGRPAQTAEQWVPDPWSGVPGARLYRTGDRVRWTASGVLEYFGRRDSQVKIRGARIELGEVEAALQACAGVRQAVADVERIGDSARLVAYIVGTATADAVRDELSARLPAIMVPSAIAVLPELPLTAHGKVDRRALAQVIDHREDDEPATVAEVAMARVWSDVLGRSRVSRSANFFALGGDSLLSLQVVARARAAGWRIRLAEIFQHQTLRALAAAARPVEAEHPPRVDASGAIPLTPIQRWFWAEYGPNPQHYNQGLLLEASALSGPALRVAIRAIVSQHAMLRMRTTHAGQRQWIATADDDRRAALTTVDLDRVAPAARRHVLARLGARVHASLDLQNGPVFRAAWLRFGDAAGERIFFAVHHLAIDWVSWRVIRDDLAAAYAHALVGAPATLPSASTPYAAWAAAQQQREVNPASLDHWTQTVARLPHATLPIEHDTGPNVVGSAATITTTISASATATLQRSAPAQWGVTLRDAVLYAIVEAVTTWTEESHLAVDLEGHGRDDDVTGLDVSRTVGWFTALYPVVLKRLDTGSLGDQINRLHEEIARVPDQGLSWGVLRWRASASASAFADAPAPGIAVNYLGSTDHIAPREGTFRLASEWMGPTRDPQSPRRHLLVVEAFVADDRLQMRWEYAPTKHRPRTIAQIAERARVTLERAAVQCARVEEAASAT